MRFLPSSLALLAAGALSLGVTASSRRTHGAASNTVVQSTLSIVEFKIPRSGSFPHDPAVTPDGIVWYTDQTNSFIGRLDPATGEITDYRTPTPGSGPHGIEAGPDGMVWYTAQLTARLGRMDPKTRMITEFPLPPNARNPHTPIVHGGKIWFTDANNNTYGVLDPE